MHVAQLWRYPVKSMIGEEVDHVDVERTGVVGDRVWATRDLERGGIRGAKKIAGLMRLAARSVGHDVVITLPDGREVSTADEHVHELVSAAVGHPVRLEHLRPAEDLEHFRRGGPDHEDLLDELRSIFGRTPDEPLPDLQGFPPAIAEFESPPGTYYDAFPLLVVTTAALESLRAAVPSSVVDVRRFRPSMVIATDDRGHRAADGLAHPELGWVGRSARIGEVEIEFVLRCPRCVMVTRAIDDDTPADRAVLGHIVRELDQNLGVYAEVRTPGRVHVGDRLELV